MSGYCKDCKRVLVCAAGDTVCTECGLVFEDHYVNERGKGIQHDVSGALSALVRFQNSGSDLKKGLVDGFASLDIMAERLQLVQIIKDRAKEIFKTVTDDKRLTGKRKEAVLAACLFQACKLEGTPRGITEILTVAPKLSKKELGKAIHYTNKRKDYQKSNTASVTTGDLLGRYCSLLGMNTVDTNVCKEIAEKIKQVLDLRRSPISIAAVTIYMVNLLKGPTYTKSFKDISKIVGVGEKTIKAAYNDIRPYVQKLVPEGFVNLEGLY